MVGLLSRQLLLPKPDNTFTASAQLQTGAEPPQILLDIGATANRLDAAANVLEERVLRVLKPVINPPAITVLFHQARALQKLEMSAGVRLRHVQRIDELADAKTFFDGQQAASKPQPQTVTQCTK